MTVKDKASEPLCVWHLLVAMSAMFYFMNLQFTAAMREIYAIREQVEMEQASQAKTIIEGLQRLNVPIKELIR